MVHKNGYSKYHTWRRVKLARDKNIGQRCTALTTVDASRRNGAIATLAEGGEKTQRLSPVLARQEQ
jgi:hypothetical protein